MGNYPVGRLIAELRNRRRLSQAELSEGICAASTLSKIENGAQMPSRRVYMALLQRLGVSHRNCQIYVSSVDMRRSVYEDKIGYLNAKGKYQKAYDTLVEYIVCGLEEVHTCREACDLLEDYARSLNIPEESWKGDSSYVLAQSVLCCMAQNWQVSGEGSGCLSALELQYALFQLGIILMEGEHKSEQALELLRQAILLTMRDTSPEYLAHVRFFTREELQIFCLIAVICYADGEHTYAKRILFLLRDYLEEPWIDTEEKLETYPRILYYLSIWMGEDDRKDRQIEFCDRGIELCIQCGRLTMLPQLLTVKGFALAEDSRDQAEPILKQAHMILQMVGETAQAEDLREKARNLFQMEIMTTGDSPGMN